MNADTLDRLYRAHNDDALRTLRRVLGGHVADQAEDALSDAWLTLAGKPEDYLAEHDEGVTGWLIVVARRNALATLKRQQPLSLDAYIMGERAGTNPHQTAPIENLADGHGSAERAAIARIELAELLKLIRTSEQRDPRNERRVLSRGRRTGIAARMLGLSYQQTMAATGRSYTNVNRCVAEGRAVARERLT